MKYIQFKNKENINLKSFYTNNYVFAYITGYKGHILINQLSSNISNNQLIIIPIHSEFSCHIKKINSTSTIDVIIINKDDINKIIKDLNIDNYKKYNKKGDILKIENNNIIRTNYSMINILSKTEIDKSIILNQSISFILKEILKDGWNINNTFSINTKRSVKSLISELVKKSPEQSWTLITVSKELNTTPSTLRRHLKKENISFSKLLLKIRLGIGLNYLTFSNHSILKVSYLSGFNSSAYFCDVFKKEYHMTPSEFRINSRNNNNLKI